MIYEKIVSFYGIISWICTKIFNIFTLKQSPIHALTEIVLWTMSSFRQKRLHIYDTKSKDLVKTGLILSGVERELEHRRPLVANQTDNVLIFGVNSNKDRFLASISISSKNLSSAWFYLRISETGKTYKLPSEKLTNVPRTGQESFVSGGLRIRCLIPMRKWRISYNGMMIETNGKLQKDVHVKFSFVWTCSSSVHDLQTDISPTLKATFYSNQRPGFFFGSDFKNLENHLDSYVQAGDMIGSISVDSDEDIELHLWGTKKRNFEMNEADTCDHLEFMGYTKEGQMFHVGCLEFPTLNSHLNYGFVVLRTSFSEIMNSCTLHKISGKLSHIVLEKDGALKFVIDLGNITEDFSLPTLGRKRQTQATILPITLEDDSGQALLLKYSRANDFAVLPRRPILSLPIHFPLDSVKRSDSLVVQLGNKSSQLTDLTGGKGSSLGLLTHLKDRIKPTFLVPKGVVATVYSYEEFLKQNKLHQEIKDLEAIAWGKRPIEDIEEACLRLSSTVKRKTLPEKIQVILKQKLALEFGEDYNLLHYAVRSSASGEDSEEMSAAGQMTTFLGVTGCKKILDSIVSCWASQFSLTAIQYKRQNGQLLNSPMAVVIQEMVPADVAGVMFTCDPVTGSPKHLAITANYGIGESVVSASAEPDTITFERDLLDKLTLKSVDIGGKTTRTIMKESGEVVDELFDDQSCKACSLSILAAKDLAVIGIQIAETYGCPMDIEWAVKDKNIYLLQARPITTVDQENEYELIHELNSGFRCETEFSTRANIGEILPSAVSPLGSSIFRDLSVVSCNRYFNKNLEQMFKADNLNDGVWCIHSWYMFINIPSMVLRFYEKGNKSFVAESTMISGFGRVLDDPEMMEQAHKRQKFYKKGNQIELLLLLIYDIVSWLWKRKKVFQNLRDNIVTRWDRKKNDVSAIQLYVDMFENALNDIDTTQAHINSTASSSMANAVILGTLASSAGEWSAPVFGDFSRIAKSSSHVESADVPKSIEILISKISACKEKEQFIKMNAEVALKWLMSTSTESGKSFRRFLDRHGHRGLSEFDVHSHPWREDTVSLVEKLQEMVANTKEASTKTDESTLQTIRNLKVPLSWKNKLLFRFLIPLCRMFVANREESKSHWILLVDQMRKSCNSIASRMVEEGRLPEEELLFFLSIKEIHILLQTRSPKLIQKAVRRRALFPKVREFQFPEIVKGVTKPVNLSRNEESFVPTDTFKGTPVSMGIIKASARVAVNLEEAKLIRKGEILVTHGTDIGWSPYFPLLAGVATELGGLVSHGAVVAREYGLPCVVGVHGAVAQIKTGDLVLLDGNKGILQRLRKD